jgi:hypothetical protein
MAIVKKQDSNTVGYRIAKEQSIGVLPGSPVWEQIEPNDGGDVGSTYKTVDRNPINSSRQRKKGTIVDFDTMAGFPTDVTSSNMYNIMQGFLFANARTKNTAVLITAVNGSGVYSLSSTAGIVVGSLIWASGFANAANNGLKVVSAVVANTSVTLSGTSVVETPATTSTLTAVGYRTQTTADLKIDASGVYPVLTSTSLNFTTLGLIPGEYLFIGGDNTANQFATAANNGFKRIKSVSANAIVLDKSTTTMVTDTASGKSVDIYFGRVIKNEIDTNIVRSSYQIERTLGAPDDAQPTQIQSEYEVGCVPSELTLNMKMADKLTAEVKFVALRSEFRTGVQGVKSGTRPNLTEREAINNANDLEFCLLTLTPTASANPTPLLNYLTDATITINNNIKPNKALGILGSFELSTGTLNVDIKLNGYFNDIALQSAVQNNSDATFAAGYVKANTGLIVDVPLGALGEAKIEVKQDEPIMVPLTFQAASGLKYDTNMNHTILFVFFDYLPTLATTLS